MSGFEPLVLEATALQTEPQSLPMLSSCLPPSWFLFSFSSFNYFNTFCLSCIKQTAFWSFASETMTQGYVYFCVYLNSQSFSTLKELFFCFTKTRIRYISQAFINQELIATSKYGRRLMCWRSWVWIPAPYNGWTFFTYISCTICNVCLKRRK